MGAVFALLLAAWAYCNIFLVPFTVYGIAIVEPYLVSRGLVMYRDIAQHHSPLLRFILEAYYAVAGLSYESLRIFYLLTAFLLLASIFWAARQIHIRVAYWATGIAALLLFPLLLFSPFVDELWVTIGVAILFGLTLAFLRKPTRRVGFLLGLIAAASVLIKQAALGAPVAAGTMLFLSVRKDFVKHFGALLLGALTIALPILAYFAAQGALSDFWYYNVTFNLTNYNAQTTAFALWEGARMAIVLLLPAALLFFLPKTLALHHAAARRAIFVFLPLLAIALWPSWLAHHLVIAIPVSAVGYALFFSEWWQRSRSKTIVMAIVVTVLVALLQKPPLEAYVSQWGDAGGYPSFFLDYDESLVLAASWVKEHTTSDERIMVLGNPLLLSLSNRLPANKYIYAMPWHLTPYEKTTLEVIKSSPRIVTIEEEALTNREDYTHIADWPFLQYLHDNYSPVATFDQVRIYEKKVPISLPE